MSTSSIERGCLFQAQALLFLQKLPAITALAIEWLIMNWSLNIFHCFDIVCLGGCRILLYFFRVSIFIKYNVDAFIILNMWFVTLTFQFSSVKHSWLVTSRTGLSSLLHVCLTEVTWKNEDLPEPEFCRCCFFVPCKHSSSMAICLAGSPKFWCIAAISPDINPREEGLRITF